MFMLLLLMLLVQSEGRDLRGHYHRRHPKRGGGDVNATVEKSPYSFERITEETAKVLAECPRAKPCFRYPGLYGYALDYYVMVDPQRQILMEFSPKAGCTAAVVTFLEAMGFKQGEQYFGWPHTFRDTYYTPHCGVYTPCHYYDENWFRFKVVRNPFDRAVSGYLESLGYPMVSKLLPDEVKNMSFERFIDYQLSLPADKWQFIANRHAGPQSQYYERFVYSENLKMPDSSPKYPPIFHEIVKTEESEEGFNRIFEKTGVRYQLRYTSKHFSKKNSEINYYVGKLSFEELYALGAVPQNYGYFYNEELKKKAEKLFEWDMLLYNYSFPYKIIG